MQKKMINTDNCLSEFFVKWENSMDDHTSEFNLRVIVKEILISYIKDGIGRNGKNTYKFDWHGVIINPTDGSLIAKMKITSFKQQEIEFLTLDRLETLMTSAMSGIYSTPYDTQALYNAFNGKLTYACEECDEDFENIEDYVEHLRESGHEDSIFDDYPHWEI